MGSVISELSPLETRDCRLPAIIIQRLDKGARGCVMMGVVVTLERDLWMDGEGYIHKVVKLKLSYNGDVC